IRNQRGLANARFERREHQELMAHKLSQLRELLGDPHLPREVAVSAGRPFSAKSEVRELLGGAETPVLVVDPYVGLQTLDCLRDVKHAIRLLTGTGSRAIEVGFPVACEEFRSEGREMVVRRHSKLHDRHVVFNDRRWLIGSSLKDAGNK